EQEKDMLAKYVGWGGLADVFDESKKGQWENSREFLKANLSKEEYTKARESTLTAFFTPKTVIDNIYNALDNLGFSQGKILEPSSGIGNFIGNIPEKMEKSEFYSVELDELSGRIQKALYPQTKIQINGFENADYKNNSFDVAIGNVPFGEFKVNDREYDKNNFLIHDYFFAKSIDKVRPGGVIAFITSSGTMDKKDESIRRYIGERCELLGAVRLPNNTFKGVAGTEVTSDIIFLKKREEKFLGEEEWYKTSIDSKGLNYNKYFIDNPQMIMGNMTEISGRFGSTITCEPTQELKDLLPGAIENIKGTYKERDSKEEDINITYYQT
ncbi:N-6 DNA methylase, partial [Fusobacterium animalis]